MNKAVIRYIWILAMLTMLTALFNSEITMIVSSAMFAVASLIFPLGITLGAAALCTFLYAFMSVDMASGAILALAFIAPALAMAAAVKAKKGIYMIIGSGTLVRALGITCYYMYEANKSYVTIKELLSLSIPQSAVSQLSTLGYGKDEIALMEKMWSMTGEIIPAMILISSFVFALLAFAVVKLLIRRTGGRLPFVSGLGSLRANIGFTLASALIFSMLFFTEGAWRIGVLNAVYFIFALYIVFGLATEMRIFKKLFKMSFPALIATFMTVIISFGLIPAAVGIIGSLVPVKSKKDDVNIKNEE